MNSSVRIVSLQVVVIWVTSLYGLEKEGFLCTQDSTWVKNVAARYQQLRAGNWSDAAVQQKLGSITSSLTPAAVRTLTKWSDIIGQPWIYSTPQAQFEGTVGQINDWLLKRLRWLDGAFQQALDPSRRNGPYLPSYSGATAPGQSVAPPAQALAGK
eukprot:jgi/Botrbrau1/7403/Bobra.0112s0004.1